jgi:hypothetical protein
MIGGVEPADESAHRMADHVHGAEPEAPHDQVDIRGSVGPPERHRIAGLAAQAGIDRHDRAAVIEPFRILVHRFQVRAATVQQHQWTAGVTAVPTVGDRDPIGGDHHIIHRTHRPLSHTLASRPTRSDDTLQAHCCSDLGLTDAVRGPV